MKIKFYEQGLANWKAFVKIVLAVIVVWHNISQSG